MIDFGLAKNALSKVDDRLTGAAKSLAEIWGYLGLFGAGCGFCWNS